MPHKAAPIAVSGMSRGWISILVAFLCLAPLAARAGEDADAYRQLMRRYEMIDAELQNVIREMDCPAPVPDYTERVLSIRKNAVVTIGGGLRADYVGAFASSLEPDPGDHLGGSRLRTRTRTSDLYLPTTRLTVDARITDRWRAYVDMNLNGFSGFHRIARTRNPNAPGLPVTTDYGRYYPAEFVNEAYVELLKPGHSGFGLRVGAMRLPFGLSIRQNLVGRSYLDAPDLTGSYLMSPMSWDNGVRLPHASALLDPAVAALATYELRDIVRFEAALFQDRDNRRLFGIDDDLAYVYDASGRRYRSESSLPRSWQVGLSLLPLEGWELSAHLRNRYSRSRGVYYWADSPYRWDFRQNLVSGNVDPSWDPVAGQWSDTGSGPGFGSRSNEQAFVVGLAVEIPNTKLAVQLEYAHGWNQGFNKYLNSDDVNFGLSYRLTPFLTLFGQAEWMQLKDRSWMVADSAGGWARDSRNNHLYRFLLGAEYELARGLTLEGGWQYEYWKLTSSMGGPGVTRDERVNTANMFYLGTRFIF